ncbi:hypothetical protein [Thalassotalea castellviae]|uniref:Alkaline phosphatase family protein n=1 Tax=Thalassotalea castellviae TaxID=3075612 RepID=A0ABU3A0U4_9GAMM|nr:hypothetical protein [Thalassotalea sp. W431]MDT0603803.1 hypothetical protein [Thalassotalea sp. W431]
MHQNKNVILLEFNELCPTLLKKFMSAGHLPNFKKLYENSDKYITDAGDDLEYLEPWVQWVTLHTGIPHQQHGVFRLGEADNLNFDNIWDKLSDKGKSSWLCGSMNAKWRHGDKYVTAIPDPWSLNASASSEKYKPYYDFVRANVQEHTNKSSKNSIASTLAFLKFMIFNGLTLKTLGKICSAVWKSIFKAKDNWKKATILDWLQFDVFSAFYKKNKPNFATYFSNSTAHFQHKYWRYMEPEKFEKKPTQNEIDTYQDAILFAYKNHDELIGETFKLKDENTQIILASALSQQPFADLDAKGGKIFYRPHDINNVGQTFGLNGVKAINPVMSHQFQIIFESDSQAKDAQTKLSKATLNGHEVFKTKLEGDTLFCGCSFHQVVDTSNPIDFEGKEIDFSRVFYLADSLKSGKHHPHGVLWVSQDKPSVDSNVIPLTEAHDIILNNLINA